MCLHDCEQGQLNFLFTVHCFLGRAFNTYSLSFVYFVLDLQPIVCLFCSDSRVYCSLFAFIVFPHCLPADTFLRLQFNVGLLTCSHLPMFAVYGRGGGCCSQVLHQQSIVCLFCLFTLTAPGFIDTPFN